ncbi:MAG TPA: aminoglycoside phosphotransferase family protein [Anaerolineales bacterium]|nr:aminoglycoside phosphotransferase family protein [Anaerolineales bacterium]
MIYNASMKEILLDQPVARGRTADVYDWDDGHILKLFQSWFETEDIEYEHRIASAVHASGVKSPAVGDIVQLHGRTGLIYERVPGESMLEKFRRQPWKVMQFGKMLAGLHAQMHGCAFNADVPAQRKKLQKKLKNADALPVALKTKLIGTLEALPEGDRVCHGDFHFANVLLAGDNATVIDWIDATRGNPLADVARTSIILLGAASSSQISNLVLKIIVRLFHAAYLGHYFRLRPGGEVEYRRWLPVVAGARLNENIPELERWLIKQAYG